MFRPFALAAALLATPALADEIAPHDFDLADMQPADLDAEDGRRYLLGTIERDEAREQRTRVRLRGTRIKIRVPIG